MALERGPLLADDALTGAAWCRAHSQLVDGWLSGLFEAAVGSADPSGVALVAVGGYGRAELAPQSDIDVMLLHDGQRDVKAMADRIWYPIWDENLKLGHSVTTVREAAALASGDLDTATALLSARLVAGDAALAARLADAGREQWERRAKQWLGQLAARVEERHRQAGEVAFLLEPDLKDGRGGLRDVHSLHWAEAARRILLEHDTASLAESYRVLLDARVELHRATGRSQNVLVQQDQAEVARALGDADGRALMARIASAARAIAWTSDDTWRRVASALRGPLGRVARRATAVGAGPGILLRDGEIVVSDDALVAADPVLALRAAAEAARRGAGLERHSLERLAREAPPMPDPWPAGAREALVDLLLTGPAAVPVIEALDQRGVWVRLLPEWGPVRARPQNNPYHRFTVDRHLVETAAHAAGLVDRVSRPDLLVLGALLHDLGKGYPGDHTEVGVGLAKEVGTRMGLDDDDVAVLAGMVEHHLLLPDVATRRDLDEPATIERVAASVGTPDRLALLAALTEADASATGPAAWSPWKAEVVARLVERVAHVLGGGESIAAVGESFPTAAQLAWLAGGGRHIEAADGVVVVVTDDRPGVFSRVAGVLALHGLDVLAAAAHSSETGRALNEFRVVDRFRAATPWPKVVADLELAMDGRLALNARVQERAVTYGRAGPEGRHPVPVSVSVAFDNESSADATIIDVHTVDAVGVLFRITRALAELDLDIRTARVQTLGDQVVDAFYVRDRQGRKVTDRHDLVEVDRAIVHSLKH
jgi:[protein-PII] uridylyltransferase